MRYEVAVAEPEAPMLQVPETVYAVWPPAHVMVMAVTDAPAEPVLVRVRYARDEVVAQANVVVVPALVKSAARSAFPVIATCAVFSPSPNTPKTKPLTATEAIRVTATTRTVAMIGEIARPRPSLLFWALILRTGVF
jgi:hypothetical protein